MTRKDSTKIANIINGLTVNDCESLTGNNIVSRFIDMLKEDNHRFDEYKFMKACGFRHGYKNEGSYIRK